MADQLMLDNEDDEEREKEREDDLLMAIDFPPKQPQQHALEEEIYEDLVYVTFRLARDKTLGLSRDDASQSITPFEPREKRDFCLREILETEKNYILALNMILSHFDLPLRKLLSPQDRTCIFLHIKSMHELHSLFYEDLQRACSQQVTTSESFSSCFLAFKEKFTIYGEFCANLPLAQTRLDSLCASDVLFQAQLERCQQKANKGKFKLRDLLSLPMQRVLKYHLLLQELIKSSDESATRHDLQGLRLAHDAMIDLGLFINEVKRDSETCAIIEHIQNSIVDLEMPDNTRLSDYGRLVWDGEARVRKHDENALKTRHLFVFDKVLLMCKPISTHSSSSRFSVTRSSNPESPSASFSYKEALILADFQLEPLELTNQAGQQNQSHSSNSSQLTSSLLAKLAGKNATSCSHGWSLIHRQTRVTFSFFAKSEALKRRWVEAIERALDNVCPLACRLGHTDHTFAMSSFQQVTRCADCEKLLRGTFFQGYQCTVCGIAVHKDCIPSCRSCGAPTLPPRPPSLPPPISPSISLIEDEEIASPLLSDQDSSLSLSRQNSSHQFDCQIDSPLNQAKLDLADYNWFAGEMEREAATAALDRLPNGAFLVRISSSKKQRQNQESDQVTIPGFAISIAFQGQVKHMKVCVSRATGHFYLSESRFFASIVSLVEWYQKHSLSESFHLVDTTLALPYKQTPSVAIALYAFASEPKDGKPTDENLLPLMRGERVIVLSKSGEQKGWWKGKSEKSQRVGYFPLAYVKEVTQEDNQEDSTELEHQEEENNSH